MGVRERNSQTNSSTPPMADEDSNVEITTNSIDASLLFHLVYDVLAFLLYMHQQIPSMLQDMTLHFDSLQTEYKDLEILLTETELGASSRRINIGRRRDVKLEVRRFEKLMTTISKLRTAFLLLLAEVPSVEDVIFVFGASPRRPQHVYEMCFSNGKIGPIASENLSRCRMVEVVSRKVIRALISKGVGSASYTGPSKLFFLVKAPSSLNLPLHFLPKREFQCTKKVLPFRLQLKSRIYHQETDSSCWASNAVSSFNQRQNTSSELMWFQCRHVIKGLALGNPSTEE